MLWDDNHVAAFDFETSGKKPEYALQPWRIPRGDAWATSLVWVWPEARRLLVGGGLAPDRAMMRDFLQWALDTERRLWGWNTIYDISVLLAYGLDTEVFKLDWGDGMLLWRHVEIEPEYDDKGPVKSYGLKAYVSEFIPEHAGYEQEVDFHDPDPEVRRKLHEYNIKDTAFTLRGCKRLWNALSDRQRSAALLEAECLPLVAAANLEGLLVDTIASHDLSLKLAQQAVAQLAKLAEHGVTEKIVRSPKQLASLMFDADKWGLTPLKKSAAGNWSTDKDTLFELALKDPRVKELRAYREALNQKTKFADGLIEAVEYSDDCGRAHPLAHVFGTYTGRFTYSSKQEAKITRVRTFKTKPSREEQVNALLPVGFALHQLKKGEDFRSQLIAPPGRTIVEFDADAQEFKWMAIASGDDTMLHLCTPGEDAHSFMAARMDHEFEYRQIMALVAEAEKLDEHEQTPPHKRAQKVRKGGKVGNLSLQYRTSPKTYCMRARVDYGVMLELPEAERQYGIYHNTYRGIKPYWGRQIALTKQLGYVETFAGRRVQVRGDWSGPFSWGMGSTSINYKIQGTGGDQKYLALSVTRDYCTGLRVPFMFDMHDGLYWSVPDELVHDFCARMKPMLDNMPYEKAWGFKPPIPLTWSCKAGKTWGTLKGVKI